MYQATVRPRAENLWQLPLAWLFAAIILLRPMLDQALSKLEAGGGGVSVSPGALINLLIFGLAGLFVLHDLLRRGQERRTLAMTALMWGPMLIVNLAGTLVSPVPGEAAKALFWFVVSASTFLLAAIYRLPSSDRRSFTMLVVGSGIVPLLAGLALAALHPHDRLQSTFGHPNIFAFFLLLYGCFVFHAAMSGRGRFDGRRLGLWMIFGAACLCLVLTQTRSAWGAMLVFLVGYTLFTRPLLLLPMLIAAPAALLIPQVHDRVFDVVDSKSEMRGLDYVVSVQRGDIDETYTDELDSGTWRKWLWQSAWPSIMQKPLTGHGLHAFKPASVDFFPLAEDGGSGAHSVLFQILFDTGLLGLAVYLWSIVGPVGLAIASRTLPRADKVFLSFAAIAFNIASASDNMLDYLSVNIFFWFLVGSYAGAALPPLRRSEPVRAVAQWVPVRRRPQMAVDRQLDASS